MYSCYIFIIFCLFVDSFGDRQANRDINRIYQPLRSNRENPLPYISQDHWPIENNILQTNDYDDNSSRYTRVHPPMHVLYPSKETYFPSPSEDEEVIKIHQPREDPKFFYQSEEYLKERNSQNANHEVASVYPGRELVRAGEKYRIPKHLLKSQDNDYVYKKSKLCIQCPRDRTLVAKFGVDKVILQSPDLKTCSGRRAPKSARFIHLNGPKFGTLLQQGSHVILGRIRHNNDNLQLCKIQVHVIIQTCKTPKYLISHCRDRGQPCNFTCRNESLDLQGESSLICGDDMTWEGYLPKCRARNWCRPLPSPEYGRISCRGTTVGKTGLTEGSRCRIRCPSGWKWYPESVSVCRRGVWTNILKCVPKTVIST